MCLDVLKQARSARGKEVLNGVVLPAGEALFHPPRASPQSCPPGPAAPGQLETKGPDLFG